MSLVNKLLAGLEKQERQADGVAVAKPSLLDNMHPAVSHFIRDPYHVFVAKMAGIFVGGVLLTIVALVLVTGNNDQAQVAHIDRPPDKNKVVREVFPHQSMPLEASPKIKEVSPEPKHDKKPVQQPESTILDIEKQVFEEPIIAQTRPLKTAPAINIDKPVEVAPSIILPANKPVMAKQDPQKVASTNKKKRSVSKPIAQTKSKASIHKQTQPQSAVLQAQVLFEKARAYTQQGRIAEAENIFEKVLQTRPSHEAARISLAGLQLESGRWVEALSLLETGNTLDRNNETFLLWRARILVEQGADTEALALLETRPSNQLKNADYLAFLATLYQRHGFHYKANLTFRSALAKQPFSGKVWLGHAISLEAIKNWRGAHNAYLRALDDASLNEELRHFANERMPLVQRLMPE
ncbi:MAG: tetratricopeptide repeat protein [Gammaproteobacteria bacterium]|nr:tetratricopeptide repeat protein [Gammaproteobacteria bacterium]MDH5728265.1 tetratricopeptide repeat protein [Gammaproteobacteria bacterium]